jgi:hypothetical protein
MTVTKKKRSAAAVALGRKGGKKSGPMKAISRTFGTTK